MTKEYNSMKGINNYDKKLSSKNKSKKTLRGKVGGFWEEIGILQLNFMIDKGLKPEDSILDIGCGCLRGGIKFINYLNPSNYFGLDINQSLIDAGMHEIDQANLSNKNAHLLLDSKFNIDRFNKKFDFMLSVSVFTHLPLNIIIRCLHNVRNNLTPKGKYYSTIFLTKNHIQLEPLMHNPHNIITYFDKDPFHYSFEEIQLAAQLTGLKVKLIGDWNHPRAQQMLEFSSI